MRRKNYKFRRNFDASYDLAGLIDPNSYRPKMEFIHFFDDNAYATNSHILACVPIRELFPSINEEEVAILNNKAVHYKAYKNILKYDIVSICQEGISCGTPANNVLFRFGFVDGGVFVAMKDILTTRIQSPLVHVNLIALNAKLLSKLAKAIGASESQVTMSFSGMDQAILIKPKDECLHSCGIIMPLMIQNNG